MGLCLWKNASSRQPARFWTNFGTHELPRSLMRRLAHNFGALITLFTIFLSGFYEQENISHILVSPEFALRDSLQNSSSFYFACIIRARCYHWVVCRILMSEFMRERGAGELLFESLMWFFINDWNLNCKRLSVSEMANLRLIWLLGQKIVNLKWKYLMYTKEKLVSERYLTPTTIYRIFGIQILKKKHP